VIEEEILPSLLKIIEIEVKSLPQSHIYITANNHRNRGKISSPMIFSCDVNVSLGKRFYLFSVIVSIDVNV
jgi:hypothetical protein